MGDNLPLIPNKGAAICADVRPVLREIFRDFDYLPPLVAEDAGCDKGDGHDGDHSSYWIEKYSSECNELWQQETELKKEYARRISREQLPNIYKLYSPDPSKMKISEWKTKRGIIQRSDLKPSIEQNAGRDETLWIKNILNRSSGDISRLNVQGSRMNLPLRLMPSGNFTIQTLSIGEVAAPDTPAPASEPCPPQPPDHIVCVPPQLDFINFTLGKLHTQMVRLVNVSKFEVRLSIRPPSRRELDIELMGTRGLTVTSGAAAELRVRFVPSDVRAVRDEILVRVSVGQTLVVPIACYMQPPLLEVLVPNVTSSALSCTPGGTEAGTMRASDILDLGARLLGDVHCVRILLHCSASHASFFLLTEEAWLASSIEELTWCGSLVAGPFVVYPTWWAGGGTVRGSVWCRAPCTGLHATQLRVLASTAIVRPLHLLADALYFRPDHITIQAHEKDYDICSEDDPACQYYVHLGTAFPHRTLSATVYLANHSPVAYIYYWSVRPWGVCSCWEDERATEDSRGPEDDDSERLCPGAQEARSNIKDTERPPSGVNALAVRVEPGGGRIAPRSSCPVHVCVPDVGRELGTQRAVLMLVLKEIPKESFPPDYEPMTVSSETVDTEPIPGIECWSREVCEVVCAQLEVWWQVDPVRFVLEPPVLVLPHSRRIQSIDIEIHAIQLYGCDAVKVSWQVPKQVTAPPAPRLTPLQSSHFTLRISLPELPNEYPETDVITMLADHSEWLSKCSIVRHSDTRHPELRPARVWLGLVPPGTHMRTTLHVFNNTHQDICWWGVGWRWHGENAPSAVCAARAPCARCRERVCSCALLRPTRGALPHATACQMLYDVNAPTRDGCVATLVQVRRTSADVAHTHAGAGTEARAALVSYRVLAPRLVLRAVPCLGSEQCGSCCLDEGTRFNTSGTAVLRPSNTLTVGRKTCYRLRFTNLTPLPTAVKWDTPIESEEKLKVLFIPNEFEINAYAKVDIQVVLEARAVCSRRVFVYRCLVDNAYKPMYLLIDTAISGLEIIFEAPIGGEVVTKSYVAIRRSQLFQMVAPPYANFNCGVITSYENSPMGRYTNWQEELPRELTKMNPSTPEETFRNDDHKRELVKVWEPPPFTRVCPCRECTKPTLPEDDEPYCLQFRDVPLKTVRHRKLSLRNMSAVTARWSGSIRRWPRVHTRTVANDQWAGDVRHPGLAVECSPPRGTLAARGRTDIAVSVYADCWGLYRDQLLIQIENLEPIILDIWVEVTGPPLQFVMRPTDIYEDESPILWMSSSDPERKLRVKNTSRSKLTIHAYLTRDYEYPQQRLPFRLYLRLFDVLPRTCPCLTAFDSHSFFSEESVEPSSSTTVIEEMDTGFEVYLAADYGDQDDTYFNVEPEVRSVAGNSFSEWSITLNPPPHDEIAPQCTLLLRIIPEENVGESWYRREPFPQTVKIRQALREGRLRLSCKEVRVRLCALDLPHDDVMRVRKRFRVQNVGDGPLHVCAQTETPWCIVRGKPHGWCGGGCACTGKGRGDREEGTPMMLESRSSTEMCVEVCIHTEDVWPKEDEVGPCRPLHYEQWKTMRNTLLFYDKDNILKSLPLILELEYPTLNVEPAVIDFGFVTNGDTRKTYFTVSHSSCTETLELVNEWRGSDEFHLRPTFLRLAPRETQRVYLQYTAKHSAAPVEGCVVSSACARAWCCASVAVRAVPTRDYKCHAPHHDYTDDDHLLPPDFML